MNTAEVAHKKFMDSMKAIGFFGAPVSAKYRVFWDQKLSEPERSVILVSAGLSDGYVNRPLSQYPEALQHRIVQQINRACEWGAKLKGALL